MIIDAMTILDKPLIFLGSNVALLKQIEVCEDNGIEIFGIIDSQYFGNTNKIGGIPVIDTEESFNDPIKCNFYKNNFNFFCATNWIPVQDPIFIRNREKRNKLIDLIDKFNLNCINIINKSARISKYAKLGKGCFIDGNVMIEPGCCIGDFVSIYASCEIGHNSTIGRNSVLQRRVGIAGDVTIKNDVYFSCASMALKNGVTYNQGTFVHEAVYIRRGTVENEIIHQFSINQKRVYHPFIHDNNYESKTI